MNIQKASEIWQPGIKITSVDEDDWINMSAPIAH